MRQLDRGHVVEGLRVEDPQLAAISGPVVHVAHQHAVVLVGVSSGGFEDELADRLARPE